MNTQINLMNAYVADLSIENVKFHNLHWNVVGANFEQVHVYLEKLYDNFFLKFDEVAERVKMLGEFPIASNKKYLELSKVNELDEENITVKDAMKMPRQNSLI